MALTQRFEADQLYQQALSAAQRDKLNDAISKLNQALLLAPKVAEFLAARGYFYLQVRAFEQAQADFDQALRHNAYEGLANFGEGMLAYRQNQWSEAERYFERAWATQTERAEYRYMLALVIFKQGRIREAQEHMEVARVAYQKLGDAQQVRQVDAWLLEFERQA
jgi:Flp pilus assembly protein TadD